MIRQAGLVRYETQLQRAAMTDDDWRNSPEWERAKAEIADAVVNLRFDSATDNSLREAERILDLSDDDFRREIEQDGGTATLTKARAFLDASKVILATTTGDEPWEDMARGILAGRCTEAAERLALPPLEVRAQPEGFWRRLLLFFGLTK